MQSYAILCNFVRVYRYPATIVSADDTRRRPAPYASRPYQQDSQRGMA
jgi:hypothetical protein